MNQYVTRRGLLRAGGAVGLGLLATGQVASRQARGDWAQFGFDAANTHFNQYSNGPEGDARVRWTYDEADGLVRSPAVVDGVVYACPSEQVVALDVDTGEKQWTYKDGLFFTSPAVSDGRVFVGESDGRVLALDADAGTPVWESNVSGRISAPGSIGEDAFYIGDTDNLYAFDPATGDELWRVATTTLSAPAVGPDSVWTTTRGGLLAVLQNTTQADLEETNWADNGIFYAALDDTTSAIMYNNILRLQYGPPVVSDEQTYVGGDGLRAINIDPGTEAWHAVTELGINTAPALVNETLYVGGGDQYSHISDEFTANAGTVYSVDRAEGTTGWSFEADGPVNASPVATNSALYLTTGTGVVHALNIFTGNEVWRQEVGGELGVPVVTGGRMYVGSSKQGLVALEERDPTPTPTPEPTPTPASSDSTPTPTPNDSGGSDDGDTSSDDAETPTESADGGGPGFGLAGGLAGLGGLSYLLRRRLDSRDE